MSAFDLRAEIRNILDTTDMTDPGEITEKVSSWPTAPPRTSPPPRSNARHCPVRTGDGLPEILRDLWIEAKRIHEGRPSESEAAA